MRSMVNRIGQRVSFRVARRNPLSVCTLSTYRWQVAPSRVTQVASLSMTRSLLTARALALGAALLFALASAAQQPGPVNPGKGSYSNADQAAPLPGPAPKPPLSPPADAKVRLNGKKISVRYSSPQMRGRKIMGSLVPYSSVWRTGADAATGFTTSADLLIEGTHLPAGNYTLYTLPAAPDSGHPWLLLFNQQTGQWGTVYDSGRDFARIPMHSAPVSSPQQSMRISFRKIADNAVELHVTWEMTDQFVTLTLVP